MPWDPVRDLLTMQERLESLFGRATTGWVPPVDLAEVDDRYVVTIELSGLDRSAIQIDYGDSVLTVRGARPAEGGCPERYQQFERGQGQFSRAFRFALPVAGDRIAADFADGVLTVSIPKSHTDRRHIEVA